MHISFQEFLQEYENALEDEMWDNRYYICVSKISDGEKITTPIVWIDVNLGNLVIRQIKIKLEQQQMTSCILIAKGKITSYAKTIIRSMVNQEILIETFKRQFLKIDITEHERVPLHTICTKEEEEAIKKIYNMTKSTQVTAISVNDPQVKYLGAREGQYIKIVRKADSIPFMFMGKSRKDFSEVTYRVVSQDKKKHPEQN